MATAPNQVWSWDVTWLRGPVPGKYFYLYVLLDIFSRCVVGWTLARSEDTDIAKTLVKEACRKQNIAPDQLTIHADRGAVPTGMPTLIRRKRMFPSQRRMKTRALLLNRVLATWRRRVARRAHRR